MNYQYLNLKGRNRKISIYGAITLSKMKHFVSELARIHTSMPSGQLDGSFWVDKAIPVLSNRLKKLNDECILLRN